MFKQILLLLTLAVIISACDGPPAPATTPLPTTVPSATPIPTVAPTPTLVPLTEFQKGIAFTAWQRGWYSLPDTRIVLEEQIRPLGATWIALVVECLQEPEISPEFDCQSEQVPTDDELIHVINVAHENGLRVSLKPQVRGSVDPSPYMDFGGVDQEAYWAEWFDNYTDYILHYAQLAQDWDADQLKVGTELYGTTHFTDEWRAVIAQVREVYSGPLTYAATTGEIEADTVQFWDDLDYIGVDAYFPFSVALHPTVEEIVQAWSGPAATIERLAETWDKPILFTEIGYSSVEGVLTNPAEDPHNLEPIVDLQTQANAYEAVFRVFGDKPWWQGVYWWSWYPDHDQGGPCDIDFTAQGKPAEDVLRHYYGAPPLSTTSLIPTPYPVEESLIIFDNALGPDWDISAWDGEIDTGAESVVHSGPTALGVTLDAWGGIALFNPLDIAEYGYLEFYINGGPQGGQGLEIHIWDVENDTEVEGGLLCRYTSSLLLPPDEWLLVRFPLQHLDLVNRQVSINMNNAAEQPAPQFFLDDIRLVAEGAP